MANLKEQLDALVRRMQEIVDQAKSEDRELTAAEVRTIDRLTPEADELHEKIKRAEKSADLVARIGEVKDADQPMGGLAHARGGALTRHIKEAMQPGFKGLVGSGSTVTTVPVDASIDLDGRTPVSVLELVPTVKRSTPTYRYLQETSRDDQAAVVKRGAKKPTSSYTVTPRDGRLRVIAHVSESIDKYLLSDNGNLERFIISEMTDGLRRALEAEVVAGDGTGEHMTGLVNVTGSQTASDDDLLTALRIAVTKAETMTVAPAAFVISPDDWQELETTRNDSGNLDFGSPNAAVERRIWGVPVTLSTQLDSGQALLLGDGCAALSTDGQISSAWSDAEGFDRNEIKARVEGRFNLDIHQPHGIVQISITEA